MQRVNRAYEGNDLLELLTVQIEIEQIDSSDLAHASDERLGHYCAVLRDQQRALECELIALQAPFRAALDLPRMGAASGRKRSMCWSTGTPETGATPSTNFAAAWKRCAIPRDETR